MRILDKKDAVKITGAFAGALAVATAATLLIRRLNKRGHNLRLFAEVDEDQPNIIRVRKEGSRYLPSLEIFEEHLAQSPQLRVEVEEWNNQVFYGASTQSFVDCEAALNEVFRLLCPRSNPIDQQMHLGQFRDDLGMVAGQLMSSPTTAYGYLRRWKNRWAELEGFLPSNAMWLGLHAVQAGLTFISRQSLHRPRLQVEREGEKVSRMLLRVSDNLEWDDPEQRLLVLSDISDYLLTSGQAA